MQTSIRAASAIVAALLYASVASAQAAPDAPASPKPWEFSASAYGYFVPDASDYVQPTFTADHGWLHLEGRYNYEELDTGSLWVGYAFGGGETVTWELTPMFGGVFGAVDGVAPGYNGSVGWRKLEVYSEGEWVIDPGDSTANFFYNWSEATLAPVEWFRFGVVTQRTRAYQSDREIQRGLLVGVSYRRLDLTGHIFNPDDSSPIVVVALRVTF